MSSNLESDEALYWSVIIQELGQVLVTICCREPAISIYEPNVMLPLNINQLLSLVSLTLGELPLVDEADKLWRLICGAADEQLAHARADLGVHGLPMPRDGLKILELSVRMLDLGH